jgi:mRNA interferase MazF
VGRRSPVDAVAQRGRVARRADTDPLRESRVALVMRRGDVHLIRLDPTLGSEIKKTRPCVVVSPDELNQHLRTVVIAPMTTGGHAYPWRIRCRFQKRSGFVALDQIRTVDQERLIKRLGEIAPKSLAEVLQGLQEMFAE